MARTHASDAVHEAAGHAQAFAGDLFGDTDMRVAGRIKALCGKSQRLASNATVATRETIAENPLAALGVAIGLGIACGAWWAARRE
ncbi:CsbD family protein [Paraburkholderia sacchari]|uniref:CsbD family protein n=1 Tax=Paraburkholderia sacchari TaxID=159450 RepID=UPI0005428CE4|nr:CsbD family protein [Paraburkholderia sacchari]NLP60301.1 CsbD family protein [Paraburkholderia sacchari]